MECKKVFAGDKKKGLSKLREMAWPCAEERGG